MTHSYRNFTQQFSRRSSLQTHHSESNSYKNVSTIEILKSTEIRDSMNNLRYKVELTGTNISIDTKTVYAYHIVVLNCFYGAEPLVIFQCPDEHEALICDYEFMLKKYNEYVINYTSLVKAETRGLQDMEVYSEKIGYRYTKPKCCATCKWCRKTRTPKNHIVGVTGKLECYNPKNLKDYQFDIRGCHDRHRQFDHCLDYRKPLYFDPKTENKMTIYPNVKPFSVCDNWEERIKEYIPVPGESLIKIVDNRVAYAVDVAMENELSTISCQMSSIVEETVSSTVSVVVPQIIEPVVHDAISTSISTDILPAVGQAIEYQLEKNPPIIIGDPEATLNQMMTDVNGDGDIDEDDLAAYLVVNAGGA